MDVSPLIQSPPLSTTPPAPPQMKGKTIFITGACSGIGAAMSRRWAAMDANIIVADIQEAEGIKLVAELREISAALPTGTTTTTTAAAATTTWAGTTAGGAKKEKHHFIPTNVCSFASLSSSFREAASLSPTGRIDIVVANAGIGENPDPPGGLTVPADPDALLTAGLAGAAVPAEPDLRVLETNLRGVAWTIHLALFWLMRNSGALGPVPGEDEGGEGERQDRCLLLIGSLASLIALPGTPQYTASKHGVLGLFRALRGMPSVWKQGQGVRINLLCPYFIDTPIVPPGARVMLAGGGMAQVKEVVEAGTMICGDESVVGRALVVGPKVRVRGKGDGSVGGTVGHAREGGREGGDGPTVDGVGWVEWDELDVLEILDEDGEEGEAGARGEGGGGMVNSTWEVYAQDYASTEAFVRRFVLMLSRVESIRGWVGWGRDMVKAAVLALAGQR